MENQLTIILVINKIDRPDSRVDVVLDAVYDLFIDLDATGEQIDFPVLYAIGRDGIAKRELDDDSKNLLYKLFLSENKRSFLSYNIF